MVVLVCLPCVQYMYFIRLPLIVTCLSNLVLKIHGLLFSEIRSILTVDPEIVIAQVLSLDLLGKRQISRC
jgi:hypothetical protein